MEKTGTPPLEIHPHIQNTKRRYCEILIFAIATD